MAKTSYKSKRDRRVMRGVGVLQMEQPQYAIKCLFEDTPTRKVICTPFYLSANGDETIEFDAWEPQSFYIAADDPSRTMVLRIDEERQPLSVEITTPSTMEITGPYGAGEVAFWLSAGIPRLTTAHGIQNGIVNTEGSW